MINSWIARSILLLLILSLRLLVNASEMPQLLKKDNRYALLVDGQPYLILGGQVNNSSAWPASLPNVWPALEAMHANTVEAPVYWEQMEPQPGKFDFSAVDELVERGAPASPASGSALVRDLEKREDALCS